MKFARHTLILATALFASNLGAQTCPKVSYTTPNSTLKNLVAAVNCMNSASQKTAETAAPVDKTSKSGLSVDTFQIIGPQHTRNYRHVLFAVLAVPVGNIVKTVAATREMETASVTSTGGGECKIKVNGDNTVDGQCSLAGGTMYVVYRN